MSDEIGLKILKDGLLYQRLGRLYKEKYDLLWNEVQREKNQHHVKRDADIKKELQECVFLCEVCNDKYQLPFLKKALEKGII